MRWLVVNGFIMVVNNKLNLPIITEVITGKFSLTSYYITINYFFLFFVNDFSYPNSEVQLGQRVAFNGISEQQ